MSISLINQNQIKDYRSPTGIFYPTGLILNGSVNVTGAISGPTGIINNLVANVLDISGNIRSNYLSGVLGTITTGSGIVEFVPQTNTSGFAEHFSHTVFSLDTNQQVMQFSSRDSQNGWFFYDQGNWSNLPASGLPPFQQTTALIRHRFVPTGMDIFQRYFSQVQTVYNETNSTGNFYTFTEFNAPSIGFTAIHVPSPLDAAYIGDSRFLGKYLLGADYIASGAQISGLPITVPTYTGIPPANTLFASGKIIVVSGRLFVYDSFSGFSGFRDTASITGFSVPSGIVISPPTLTFSGGGQIKIESISNNQINISGGGVNQFTTTGTPFKQGNMIFSGSIANTITSVSTPSGTIIIHSGGGISTTTISGGVPRNGNIIFSGEGAKKPRLISNPSGFVISYTGGLDNIGIARNPVRNGSFIFSGENGIGFREDLTTSGANFVAFDANGSKPIDISFYSDVAITGSGMAELFVSSQTIVTGFAIGCTTTGSGDFPMNGVLFQRNTDGTRTDFVSFTFESGITYKQFVPNNLIVVKKGNRIGYDISIPLSGIRGFCLSVFGVQ